MWTFREALLVSGKSLNQMEYTCGGVRSLLNAYIIFLKIKIKDNYPCIDIIFE